MNILDIAIAKKLAGGGGGSGTDNYNDLSNLPKINDTTLSGNKSSSALGLQSEINSDSKLASDLVDDTDQDNKFVTLTEKNTWNAKQNAIDADHKINADYVDDSTSTNKFVTASDKEAWNAKQSAIDGSHKLSSDLVDDTNHTNKFVTSTEKNTWNAKQNAIDADHKLSSSLVSFTTAEAAALASGIDSTKVAQISTNQSNILYTLNRTGKNLAKELPTQTVNGVTLTNNGDGTYTITRTASGSGPTAFVFGDNSTGKLTGCIMTGGAVGYGLKGRIGDTSASAVSSNDWTTPITITSEVTGAISIGIDSNENPQNVQIRPFICEADVYAIDPSFTKPALPNYDLTYLEAQDRAALAEEIDAGAKNIIPVTRDEIKSYNAWNWNGYTATNGGITYTLNADGSITMNGTSTATGELSILPRAAGRSIFPKAGTYVLYAQVPKSLNPSGVENVFIGVNRTVSGSGVRYGVDKGDGATFTVPSSELNNANGIWIGFSGAGLTVNNVTIYPMICTKAAFGVSSKFVPYRLPYDDVQSKTTLLMNNMGGLTFHGSDLNTLVAGGRYLVNNATDNPVSNAPYSSWQTVEVFQSDYSTYPKVYYQIATDVTGATVTSKWRRRVYNSGGQYNAWTSWSS